LILYEHITRRREHIYHHIYEKTTKGNGNKYEAPGSALLQQSDEFGSFIVARELDCGSARHIN
jgi:hypothetical protein